ncbi:YheT family hydrolase [Pedobacter sandarakinus]|uniref:YheT family hydrolase n=1 Tax=Pedobacter sandarakinus TaxID=353156 RepID=UPI002245A6B1|nr:alpha/beta fold hydrolase [Pedobacter sandarakinus]MCX2575106.1 alpha/beta fold hydrolase [Pedobacter sandarakinus]
MPVLQSKYRPPLYLFNGHLQTIAPVFGVKRDNSLYRTEKMELPDGDFLELDWIRNGNNRLMVVCHGLEGNSRSHYVQQMAQHFSVLGWDILAIHARSCGREMNRLPVLYHGGATADIDAAVKEYASKYQKLFLVGFSLGGNMLLNFVGRHRTPENLMGIATFSVPCDLCESEKQIDRYTNRIYLRKFLDKLKNKVRKMERNHPGIFDIERLNRITSIQDFSANFTAPFSGFNSLDELYAAGSCLQALTQIKIPTLVVNAKNDPFLSPSSYPIDLARNSEHIFLDTPTRGGHSAFPLSASTSWMPIRVEQFLKEQFGIA